jgi:glucose uptake protein
VVVVKSYTLAVVLCFVTMLCWGSWANTQKLASREWRFPLFYWDYAFGVLLLALFLALTLGSTGSIGRSFLTDLGQARRSATVSALLGGIIFNLANILLVAAIDIAGMAVAFPIGVGIALVLGVLTNYLATPVGNPWLLFPGVAAVTFAIIVDAMAYKRLPYKEQKTTAKGIVVSVLAGLLMGFFIVLWRLRCRPISSILKLESSAPTARLLSSQSVYCSPTWSGTRW